MVTTKAGARTLVTHDRWTGVRTVSDPGEESPHLLYDVLNGTLPDPTHGSGVMVRPPINVIDNPLTGRVGHAIHEHSIGDGTTHYFVVRGSRLEEWNGSRSAPFFTDVTPPNVGILGRRVFLATFAKKLIVSDGIYPPWVYDTATGTGTYITYGAPTVSLSRGTGVTLAIGTVLYILPNSNSQWIASSPSTVITAGTVTASKWGAWRVYGGPGAGPTAAGTITVVSANPAGQAYNSEALAIAALPAAPAASWDLGYVTVQATGGGSWTPGTDALNGGTGGTPAAVTNYYAPALHYWTATWGAVYSAQLVFVLGNMSGTASAPALIPSSITWSEIDDPLTGYAQPDFDNTWTLTQTASDPLTALAATNSGLYYFRRNAIGTIRGNISRTWRTQATTDDVSTTIGTRAPASVLVLDDAIWFTSSEGLPYRFPINTATLEPVWLNVRDTADVQRAMFGNVQGVSGSACSAYSPDLRLVVMALWGDVTLGFFDTVDVLYVFSAETGVYQGRWVVGSKPCAIDAMGIIDGRLCFLGASDASTGAQVSATRGALLVHRLQSDMNQFLVPWNDDPGVPVVSSITTSELLPDAGTTKRYDTLRVRIRASTATLNGITRTVPVTVATPWSATAASLTPTLTDGVAEDRVLLCGLATPGRWIRVTVGTPSGSTLLGPFVYEGVDVTAHRVGNDRVLR